jgi:hypothetical protein
MRDGRDDPLAAAAAATAWSTISVRCSVHVHPTTSPHVFVDRSLLENEQLRSLSIQLLSANANGCLKELGYFPDILERYQRSEQSNAQYLSELDSQRKLSYNLARALKVHEDKAKFLAAPDAEKIKQLADLKEKIRVLSEDKVKLDAHCGITIKRYQELWAEFYGLQDLHRRAINEIISLREQCARFQQLSSQPGGNGKFLCLKQRTLYQVDVAQPLFRDAHHKTTLRWISAPSLPLSILTYARLYRCKTQRLIHKIWQVPFMQSTCHTLT